MRILHSYRWRRRLIIAAVVVAVAAPLGYLAVRFTTHAESTAPTGPNLSDQQLGQQEKRAPLTAAKKRQIRRVLAEFMSTAVARRHVADSWKLVGPNLRQGLTRREWSTGDIPVQPFPVAKRGLGTWQVLEYSYTNVVGLEVLMWPKAGSGESPLSADVELVRGHDGRWRVDYFLPKKYHGTPVAAPQPQPKAAKQRPKAAAHRRAPAPTAAPPIGHLHNHEGRVWWVIPLGLLALALITPVVVLLLSWYRNRRAEAAYLRWRG
jgi:hypothetical protein